MFRRVLSAAFAVVGIGLAVPAYANGQVEDAMQLWMADIKDSFDTVYVELPKGNTDEAIPAAQKLQQDAEKLNQLALAILNNVSSISPGLATSWTAAQRATNEFSEAARTVAANAETSNVDVSVLKDKHDAADDALHESWEDTKEFGKNLNDLMSKQIDPGKNYFQKDLTDSYNKTTQFIVNGNRPAARDAMVELLGMVTTFSGYVTEANKQATLMSRILADMWTPVFSALPPFQAELISIQGQIGHTNSDLSHADSYRGDLNAAIVRAYSDITALATKFKVVCDSPG